VKKTVLLYSKYIVLPTVHSQWTPAIKPVAFYSEMKILTQIKSNCKATLHTGLKQNVLVKYLLKKLIELILK